MSLHPREPIGNKLLCRNVDAERTIGQYSAPPFRKGYDKHAGCAGARKERTRSMTSVIAGIGWHIVGASMAASFYAPIGRVKKWSWETTWALAGMFSWILLPLGVSLFILPDFHAFYASMGTSLLIRVALFGAMWGVGNVSYGLTMRHLGMSLGIGVAIGVTLIVGTLVPPVMHGQAAMLFTTRSGLITMAGVVVALIGVAIVSYAGHQKELELKS